MNTNPTSIVLVTRAAREQRSDRPSRPKTRRTSFIPAVLMILFLAGHAGAQVLQQTITLQPGWNAVWLEVEPEDNRLDAVLASLPVASAWTRAERASSVEFIQDPSEQAFNEAGWLGWFAPTRPESILNNLFILQANRAYLIKSTNATAVVWHLAGRPSLRQPDWVPDAYNLRGLPVDPAAPPTFRNFLRFSPAHADAATGQLQPIHRLNSGTGQWEPVAPEDPVQPGRAYWIFTRGASDFVATFDARVTLGDGLDFGRELSQLELRLSPRGNAPATVRIRELGMSGNPALARYQFDPVQGGQWPALPNPLVMTANANVSTPLELGLRRQVMSGDTYRSVLEITDGSGARLLVPVAGEKPGSGGSGGSGTGGGQGGSGGSIGPALAGLWVGSATVSAVSEPHSAAPDVLTPVRSEFNLRLIVHVDALGKARLLREAIQMWREGTYTNDATGLRVVDKPGAYVLLTDDTLVPLFQGATVRDGRAVGRRLSTIGYDFPGENADATVEFSGAFAVGQTLSAALFLPYDHPRNPFLHKFHPDHDNLNARFDAPQIEALEPGRLIELEFGSAPPDGPASPDFGYNEMGGRYAETLVGLHKNAIHLGGTFRLSRISLIDTLNPSPTP